MRSGVEKARKNFANRTRLDVPAHDWGAGRS